MDDKSTERASSWSARPRLASPDGVERWLPLLLGGILLVAFGLRLAGVFHDLPFSYYGDELHFVKRFMALGTGDLNPHWFHKPGFLMYLLLACYGGYFAVGVLFGRFDSTEQFGAHFLQDMGPFLLMGRFLVLAFGVTTVYVVYLIALRAFRNRIHGLTAAGVAAVMLPMVGGSQVVKADVPAAFFVALSFYLFLRSTERKGFLPLALAALTAGVAMGTKYYGIMLARATCSRSCSAGYPQGDVEQLATPRLRRRRSVRSGVLHRFAI